MNKTAMQELINWIENERFPLMDWLSVIEIKNKATELLGKEKEQITDAFRVGVEEGVGDLRGSYSEYEDENDYFNKTYKIILGE